jgi:hypothetical protein
MMKAMSDHTRLNPDGRTKRLLAFNKRIHNTPASIQVMESWNMILDKTLVNFSGRLLPQEEIVFGSQS